jgi:hypothetical protein
MMDMIMNQYRVELRNVNGLSMFIDVMADDHAQARFKAWRYKNLPVLSTEFIA